MKFTFIKMVDPVAVTAEGAEVPYREIDLSGTILRHPLLADRLYIFFSTGA